MEVKAGGCLSSRVDWLPLLSVLWWKFGQGLMGCWWLIRKNAHALCLLCVGQVHPGRCAHLSAEGNGFSYKWLVPGTSSVVRAGLAFIPRGLGGPRAAALAAQWLYTAWLLGGEPPRGVLASCHVYCSF